VPLERQQVSLDRIWEAVSRAYAFDDKEAVRAYFTRLTGLFRNFNYAETESPEYWRLLQEIEAFVADAP
jgi:V/A-type H+-transporting ATPase subunit A